MQNTARILSYLAAVVCAGALAFQLTALAAPGPLPPIVSITAPPIAHLNAPNVIRGSYMLIFPANTNPTVLNAARIVLMGLGGTILYTYRDPTPGYAVSFPNDTQQIRDALQLLTVTPGTTFPNGNRVQATRHGKTEAVQSIPGHDADALDRIDQRKLPLDEMFAYNETGEDIDVYVLDTGIFTSHMDFEGRTTPPWSFLGTDDLADCRGHGTFVAGIIGGKTFGDAKKVRLHSLRVTGIDPDHPTDRCFIREDAVTAGVQEVTADHMMRQTPAVANVSLSFEVDPQAAVQGSATAAPDPIEVMEANIRYSITQGVTYVVSGGTRGNACDFSPSRMAEVIAVGSTFPNFDQDEARSWGSCIDILAPSNSMVSARPNDVMSATCWPVATAMNNKTQRCEGGTSAAAALVTGCAAQHLQSHPMDSPKDVWKHLKAIANVKGVSDMQDTLDWPGITALQPETPNMLLHCGTVVPGALAGGTNIGGTNDCWWMWLTNALPESLAEWTWHQLCS